MFLTFLSNLTDEYYAFVICNTLEILSMTKKILLEATHYQINKGLVTLKLQETLPRFGIFTLERIYKKLFDDYHCYLPDCYDNPKLLGMVLQEIFGASNHVVIASIQDSLREFSTQPTVAEFLKNLNTGFMINERTFVN